ncbi:MAG: GCN5-like N-acetyltransferase [Chthonomonadales bacterium]|nr:GCN5-like N-acetyltransferase [Chthonomonadales bacterium]
MRRWLEVFVLGFSETRSLTHPYLVRELQPSIWLLADAPRRSGAYRRSELVAWNHEQDAVMNAIRQAAQDRIALCVMATDRTQAQIEKDRYKQLGFRFIGTEPLFVVDLNAGTPPPQRADIVRVTSQEEADRVKKAARSRQITAADLVSPTPTVRLYAAFDGENALGWVRSVTTHPDRAWVSNLYVHNEARGLGIGRSLMATMLADDVRHGIQQSVLLASGAGARLYPHLGYTQQGILCIFTQ